MVIINFERSTKFSDTAIAKHIARRTQYYRKFNFPLHVVILYANYLKKIASHNRYQMPVHFLC